MNLSKNLSGKLPRKPKIIVILGPTASGKSDLAVKLALRLSSGQARKKFGINGAEIISADSRQVYKGLDIGTGKINKKEMCGIRHHMLDVASPKKTFTIVDYQKLASLALKDIVHRGKIPIICGGTGFYIDALIYNYALPNVKPNTALRKKLAELSLKTLYAMLKNKDPERARHIDPQNPRRLIRALEIVINSKKPIPAMSPKISPYSVLKLGVSLPWLQLKTHIEKRLEQRINKGLLGEVRKLHRQGLSWRRLHELGLEYRYAVKYLTKKIKTKRDFELKLAGEIKKYAKRQMTWFRQDPAIHHVKNFKQAKNETFKFLSKAT